MSEIHDNIQQYADELVHELLPPELAQKVHDHCEQCSACRSELDKARTRLIAFQEVALDDVPDALVQKSLDQIEAPVSKQIEKTEKKRRPIERFLWKSLAGAAAVLIGLSVYWQFASPPTLDMIVYGQSSLHANTDGSIRVVLFDRGDGETVAGRQINIDLTDQNNSETVRLVSFETDRYGTGTPQFRLPDWATGDYKLTVSLDGSDEDIVSRKVSLKRNWHLMLSSDKPVYQPGQTIHLKCLARRRSDSKPVGGKPVSFRVLDPKGNLIADQKTVSSEYGICAMDLPLAKEVIEGAWRVECESDEVVSSMAVTVQRYVLPKFNVAIKFDQPWFEPDQMITGSIESRYFFGQPVGDGKATIVFNPSVPGASVQELATVELDANGKGKFEFPVPLQIAGTGRNSGDAILDLVVRAQDSAGQTEEKKASCTVTATPLKVEMVSESGALVAGVPNQIFIFTSYANGNPAKTKVNVSGIPTGLETNSYGVASFKLTPDQNDAAAGNITVSATDSEGRIANREFDLSTSDAESDFVLRTSQAVYKGGESIVLNCFGAERYPVMVDVIRDQQTLLTESIEVEDGKGELVLDLPADIEGALQINAYRIGEAGLTTRKIRTVFVSRAEELKVEVIGADKTSRPGEMANLKFRLTNAEGKAVPGAFGVSIVDSAVSAVASQRLGLLTSLSEGDADLLQPLFTIYPWLPGFNGDAKPDQRELELAAFARIDSLENQNDRRLLRGEDIYSVSETTLPRKKRKFKQAQRQRTQIAQFFWSLLGIAFVIAGIGSILVRIGLSFLQATAVGFIIVAIVLSMMISSVLYTSEATKKGVAASSLALVDEKAIAATVASADSASSSPRVRKWFPETLLWRPQLITDDNGELELNVPLADSITTWKLNAQAVSLAGQLGGFKSDLKVFQPFFIDANLPVAFTRNDEVSVPVIAYNYLDKDQKVALSIREEDWFELSGAADRTLTIEAGQQKAIHFPIRIKEAGEHKLQITAIGDEGVSDAIEKSVSVEFEGRKMESVINDTLQGESRHAITIPDTAIDGSGQLMLKAYPPRFSEVVAGLDGIFQRPHGCFEQNSSTTYPSVLALSYLKSTKQSMPEIETKALRYIQEGYQRLLTFEVPGGGFDWYGRAPANKTLTAYGLMEFRDIDQVYPVDRDLIKRTADWLLSQRLRDGSWEPDNRFNIGYNGDQKLATTAYIAWSIFDGSTPTEAVATKNWLLQHSPENVESGYTLALVCNALQMIAEPAESKPWLDELLKRIDTDDSGKMAWWENGTGRTVFYGTGDAGNTETTAAAALALIESQQNGNTLSKTLRWLASKRDSKGTWQTTQATVLSLKALLDGSGEATESKVDRQISVLRDGQLLKEFKLKANQPIVQQFVINGIGAGESFELQLEEGEPSGVGYQITTRHNELEQDLPPAKSPIEIKLAYDAKLLSVDDEVSVSATIKSNLETQAAMVMVTLPVPPGFAAKMDPFEKLVADRKIDKYEQTAQNVILYLRGLEPAESIEFQYQLRATMPIKATVKLAMAWLYYDPDVRGLSDEALLTVQQ